MKQIGVVICNYNKREYVLNCVDSIQKQSFSDLDIYVVDNASMDDSVEVLESTFKEQITILQNEENLGGAGGFGRGIAHCLELGYPYILLVDNDTRFDSEAVGILYNYLSTHSEVGMCGAGILQMPNPEYIQEIGGRIDYDTYAIKPNFRGKKAYPGYSPRGGL